jgi:hypothetical protein
LAGSKFTPSSGNRTVTFNLNGIFESKYLSSQLFEFFFEMDFFL